MNVVNEINEMNVVNEINEMNLVNEINASTDLSHMEQVPFLRSSLHD